MEKKQIKQIAENQFNTTLGNLMLFEIMEHPEKCTLTEDERKKKIIEGKSKIIEMVNYALNVFPYLKEIKKDESFTAFYNKVQKQVKEDAKKRLKNG